MGNVAAILARDPTALLEIFRIDWLNPGFPWPSFFWSLRQTHSPLKPWLTSISSLKTQPYICNLQEKLS